MPVVYFHRCKCGGIADSLRHPAFKLDGVPPTAALSLGVIVKL